MSITKTTISLSALAIVTLFFGCPPDSLPPEEEEPALPQQEEEVIGDWASFDRLECQGYGSFNNYNEMEIDDDLEGTADIYFWYEYEGIADCCHAEFDIEVEDMDVDEFEIEFDCSDEDAVAFSCSDLDFTMVCELDHGDLLCEGDGVWDGYEFEWERD